MRFFFSTVLLMFGCQNPSQPQGSPIEVAPQNTESPDPAPVPKEQWKVKDAEAAKVFLQNCEHVKSGALLLTVEQEATPESPLWWIGLQIKDGPLLDRCSIDATTEKLFCRGDTCP